MTIQEKRRYLQLLERHMAAYAAQRGIPQPIRDQYLGKLTAQRNELRREIERFQ